MEAIPLDQGRALKRVCEANEQAYKTNSTMCLSKAAISLKSLFDSNAPVITQCSTSDLFPKVPSHHLPAATSSLPAATIPQLRLLSSGSLGHSCDLRCCGVRASSACASDVAAVVSGVDMNVNVKAIRRRLRLLEGTRNTEPF
ncbi:hypothetical protein CVT26_015444 [Gymnopilus dilepis]|uniref:Uncharacterized protein n=1 Tax=Gymnopilus dilepis TaxID=231916 RepID=A0A409YEK8_9AGAR|nr:hypothetical protein CVT26_015444 [Gymnopilus dilepis]